MLLFAFVPLMIALGDDVAVLPAGFFVLIQLLVLPSFEEEQPITWDERLTFFISKNI